MKENAKIIMYYATHEVAGCPDVVPVAGLVCSIVSRESVCKESDNENAKAQRTSSHIDVFKDFFAHPMFVGEARLLSASFEKRIISVFESMNAPKARQASIARSVIIL